MNKKKVKYAEGDLFVIETENQSKFLGLLARRAGRSKLLLGYFWKLDFEIDNNLILDKNKIGLITQFSGLGFELGNWEMLGKYSKWNREDWPMPKFKKFDILREVFFEVQNDDNFSQISQTKITSEEADKLFAHVSRGYESLEYYLQKTLS